MIRPLPLQMTPFFGRQSELADLSRLLAEPDCRLLSLIGPGGVGKTRLALEVAARSQEAFASGVAFVDLQMVRTPDECIAAIAAALDLTLTGQDEPWARLAQHLRDSQLLLLLDGMEQLLESVPQLVKLLALAPSLKMLVTSREVLNVQEEWRYLLDGLELPPAAESNPDLEQYSAVQLFAARTRRVRRDFDLAAEPAAVIRICHLVAGMPLALELAAAWTATMSCEAIAAEIAGNLSFLASRLRNVPERHRSMRATFEQSWQRLSVDERCVFRRLAVFRGGFTHAAAAMIVAGLGDVMLEGEGCALETAELYAILAVLVDKSLLRVAANGRYQIHELLRQFAESYLCVNPAEADWVYAQHTRFVRELVERAEVELRGPQQQDWLEQLTSEHDNLQAVLHRAQRTGDWENALRITGALWRFWWVRGHGREGRMWLEQALALAAGCAQLDQQGVRTPAEQAALERRNTLRIKALNGAGNLACAQGDYGAAAALHAECLALRRAIGDQQGIAVSLHNLGLVARDQGQYDVARARFTESLTIKRVLGDRRGMAASLDDLGSVLQHQGDFAAARPLHEESLAIKRALGDQQAVVAVLINLGLLAGRQGEDGAAQASYHEALAIARELDARQDVAEILGYLGKAQLRCGDYASAGRLLSESLAGYWALRNQSEILKPLEGLAYVAAALGHAERGAQLLAAVTALRLRHGAACPPADEASLTPAMAALRSELGSKRWAIAWAVGQLFTLEQAVQVALAELPAPAAAPPVVAAPVPRPNPTASAALVEELTERERDVLCLIADGLSNQEIAARLVISEGTVKWHTAQIYGKLGVQRRTQAIYRAREVQLLP